MKAYPGIEPDGALVVRIRAEGDGIIGDLFQEVRPSEHWAGLGYDEWLAAARAMQPVDLPAPVSFARPFKVAT